VDNFTNFKNFTLDLMFPKFCLGCQKEGIYLCDDCREILDISKNNYCLCSQKPQRLAQQQKSGKCSRCKNKELSGLYSALPYKEKNLTKKLIYAFKYNYLKELARPLAGILIEHLFLTGKNKEEIWQNSVLIPVPLEKSKQKERGYNQSEELAKELSKVLKIPVLANSLIKIKKTKPQMELKKEEREKNLLNAFAIKNCGMSDIPQFCGKKVFLVDDVYTTGSTMAECARVLKTAGAKSVWGLTIAREG
jgi:ComF family protein